MCNQKQQHTVSSYESCLSAEFIWPLGVPHPVTQDRKEVIIIGNLLILYKEHSEVNRSLTTVYSQMWLE